MSILSWYLSLPRSTSLRNNHYKCMGEKWVNIRFNLSAELQFYALDFSLLCVSKMHLNSAIHVHSMGCGMGPRRNLGYNARVIMPEEDTDGRLFSELERH